MAAAMGICNQHAQHRAIIGSTSQAGPDEIQTRRANDAWTESFTREGWLAESGRQTTINQQRASMAAIWTPPVVDMESPDAPKVLAEACRDVGFFYLENHGVSVEVMDEVFRQSKAFFSLGIDDKMTVKADKNNRGFTPLYDEILDPATQVKGDTKEGYYIYREMPAGAESGGEGDTTDRPFEGPNQWPSEELVPGWKATMQTFFTTMHALAVRVSGLLSAGLGLDEPFFEECISEMAHALRLLHYSAEVSDPGNGVMSAGAHSDYGLMTLLATDEVPGLQVRLNGEWIDVPPRKGAFICNLGDMLQRWTNDHLRSTMHRVVNKLGRERYSIPFFLNVNFDTKVVCMPQFCSEENPAKYPPVSAGKYLLGKYSQTLQDFDRDQDGN